VRIQSFFPFFHEPSYPSRLFVGSPKVPICDPQGLSLWRGEILHQLDSGGAPLHQSRSTSNCSRPPNLLLLLPFFRLDTLFLSEPPLHIGSVTLVDPPFFLFTVSHYSELHLPCFCLFPKFFLTGRGGPYPPLL